MSQKIVILKPRLDVPFKNLGPIAKKRGKIIDIFIKEGDLISEGDKLLDINYDI